MQAILETNMLCKPTTLVSIVSETRLARRHTVRTPDKHSLQPPSGLAGRSCASSADAHPFSKAECKRSEDTHAMQANVVGVCRFRNEIGTKKNAENPLTPRHPRFRESSVAFTKKSVAPSDRKFKFHGRRSSHTIFSVSWYLKELSERD